MPVLVSVFEWPDDVAQVAAKLRGRGFEGVETYSPAPFETAGSASDSRPGVIRTFALAGGLAGAAIGFAMPIWASRGPGGGAYPGVPPPAIVGFGLAILVAGVCTFLGLLVAGRLFPRKRSSTYSWRFSAEEFGVVVRCADRDVAEIDALLRIHSAKEVTLVEA